MINISMINTPDGGDFINSKGLLETDNTPYSLIYLSLFGGDTPLNNMIANDVDVLTNSALLDALNAKIDENTIKNIEQKAQANLAWLTTENILTDINIDASIIDYKTVNLTVSGTIPEDNTEYSVDFNFNL